MRQAGFRSVWMRCLAIFLLLSARVASASSPGDELRAAVERVQQILNDPQLKSEDKKADRLARLRKAIFPKFDFAEMAKRSLGAHWRRRSADEQQEFVKLFTRLLEHAYADSIDSYDGEKVVITGEKRDEDFAEVFTKIVTKKGEDFSVNYRMRETDGGWKIYDVVIENISLVNNYRSQFRRVIGKSSYEDLLRDMKSMHFGAPGRKVQS